MGVVVLFVMLGVFSCRVKLHHIYILTLCCAAVGASWICLAFEKSLFQCWLTTVFGCLLTCGYAQANSQKPHPNPPLLPCVTKIVIMLQNTEQQN